MRELSVSEASFVLRRVGETHRAEAMESVGFTRPTGLPPV